MKTQEQATHRRPGARRSLPSSAVLAALGLAAVALAPRAHAAVSYTITDLNPSGNGYGWSQADAINALGQILVDLGRTSLVTDSNGHITLLPYRGSDINDAGQILRIPADINLGVSTTVPLAFNNAGQVVGVITDYLSFTQPFMMNSNGQMADLTSIGWYGGGIRDINNLGQMTGWSYGAGPVYTNLSGNLQILGGSGAGFAINDSGQVTGHLNNHAFITDSSGHVTDLGTLGGDGSTGYGINATGQVVGTSAVAGNSADHAFVILNGVMTDLNDLLSPTDAALWELRLALDINNSGLIVGSGLINNELHAFLLTPNASPVPVPTAAWLMGSGLLGLIGLGRRKTAV